MAKGDKQIHVEWVSEAKANSLFERELARENKRRAELNHPPLPAEDERLFLWDWVEMEAAIENRRFPNLGMAQGWARRNYLIDLFENPRVYVQEQVSDDHWDWETVGEYEWQDSEWVNLQETSWEQCA